jgi:KRAB domain-containing zinc finger protein
LFNSKKKMRLKKWIASLFPALMPCEKCGRMVRVARMKLHLKIHDGYKPHVCEVCGRGFANKSGLKSHSRFNHLGVPKPFMCSTCGHMCTNKKTLEIHEMTHTDARVIK